MTRAAGILADSRSRYHGHFLMASSDLDHPRMYLEIPTTYIYIYIHIYIYIYILTYTDRARSYNSVCLCVNEKMK